MSFDDSSWRTPDKRQVMVQKLAEAMQLYPNVLVLPHNDPIYVENTIFSKARTQHDYINMVGKILMSILAKGRQQQQQWQPGMEIHAGMEWDNTKPAYLEQVPSFSSHSIPPPSNTPWNLGSPAGHSLRQPPMPETNIAIMLKLQELQSYLPKLTIMIDKFNRLLTFNDDPKLADQLTKLNSLYSVIHNKNLKVRLSTLEKCHIALRKLFNEDTPLATNDEKLQLVLAHIKEQGQLNVTTARGILYGPPRVGKTSLMKRLIGEKPLPFSPSTGIDTPITVPIYKDAECNSLIINMEWKCLQTSEMLQTCLNFLSGTPVNSTMEPSSKSVAMMGLEENLIQAHEVVEDIESSSNTPLEGIPFQIIDFVKNQDWEMVRQKLEGIENAMLFQIIDVGGQPEFHDILPLLLTGPALYLLFFNLTQDLETPYTYSYQHEDGSLSTTYTSHYTTLQILHQILSGTVLSTDDDDDEDSAAIIIGTFLDKFIAKKCSDGTNIEEVIRASIDEPLINIMKGNSYFKNILKPRQVNGKLHVVFPVNNVSGTMEDEIKPLRDFIKRVLKNLKGSPLPTTWALFYYLLQDFPKQNNGQGYCTLNKARELAKDLQIDNIIEDVLKYIHNKFGSVLYYDDVYDDKGKKYVFCDPNVILKLVNKLIAVCFGASQDYIAIANCLRETGTVTMKEFHKLCKSFTDNKDDPMLSYVIKLLERRHIISNINNTHYFIPCLLETCNDTKYTSNQSEEVAPFLLKLSSNKEAIIPPGLFSSMLVRLSMMEGWKLPDGMKRYKNQVYFSCEKPEFVSVALIAQPHWIEVRLDSKPSSLAFFSCFMIRKDIEITINKIKSSDTLLARLLKSVDLEVGFYCPHSHFAKKTNDTQMVCSACDNFKEADFDLTEKHKIWFDDIEEVLQTLNVAQLIPDVDVNHLKQIIDKVLVQYHATLTGLGSRSLQGLADKLYSSLLISQTVKDNPSMNDIVEEFKSIINLSTDLSEIQDGFSKFFNAFIAIGGIYNKVARRIHETLLETVRKQLNYNLTIDLIID